MAEQKERQELEREWMAQDKWKDFSNWLVYAKLPEVRASALREAAEVELPGVWNPPYVGNELQGAYMRGVNAGLAAKEKAILALGETEERD